MARLRTLKPSFFTHEVLAELSPLHRLLFQGLWCYADREGRLEDRPRFLKTVVLPYDDCDVDKMLWDLAERGFIIRYQSGAQRLIQVAGFAKHQKPHPREAPSDLPEFLEGQRVANTNTQTRPSSAKDMPKQCLGNVEQGGLGDIGLGVSCLGDDGLTGSSSSKTKDDHFELTAEPTKKPRKRSEGQKFFDWTQPLRAKETGLVVEDEPNPAALNSWFAEGIQVCGSLLRLQKAYAHFLRPPESDRYWLERGCPFAGFMSAYRKYVPPEERAA